LGHYRVTRSATVTADAIDGIVKKMTNTERYRALERRYHRLLVAAENLVRDTRSIGSPEAPACAVPPHRIKTLRREIDGEPQPTALATMGPT
jgi:hypothetical protein